MGYIPIVMNSENEIITEVLDGAVCHYNLHYHTLSHIKTVTITENLSIIMIVFTFTDC